MKRLYELALSTNAIKEKTIVIEFALADSRNLHSDFCGEHWGFQTDKVQLQAINCYKCGNYKCISESYPLTNKIKCECLSVATEIKKSEESGNVEDYDMYALDNDGYSYNKELAKKMVLYDQMGAFMDVEKDCDLLCEDVVGLILEYLQ